MTQEVLAGFSGVCGDYISQIERGLYAPSIDTLEDIADALGVKPFMLIKD